MLIELVHKNRSYRRFQGDFQIDMKVLKELVDMARLANSAANRQPLKYILSTNQEKNDTIFNTLGWAGYLKDWSGPAVDERPSAYIIILGDSNITENYSVDPGIASAYIMLGAAERELGGCIFGSVNRKQLREELAIPDYLQILYVLALGKPVEEVQLETVKNGDIKYWRDEEQVHHVPKRELAEVIIELD